MFTTLKSNCNKFSNMKIDDIILNMQNITLMGISLYSLYCCINYYMITGLYTLPNPQFVVQGFDNNSMSFIKPFDNLSYFVQTYVFIDLLFVKKMDACIHHLCVIGISFYNWYSNADEIYRIIFSFSLIKTELSSIFLVLTYWLPKNTYAYNINSVFFYLSFIKFRIIDMYTEIIHGNYTFNIVINKYTPNNLLISSVLYVSIYVLYLLNMYWFLIITKIWYKQFLHLWTFKPLKI
jgi:hypothetical protein